jgi:nickel-dependent lactate racemase
MTAVAQDPNKEAAKAAKVTSDLYRVMVNNSQSATNVIDGFEVQTNIVFKNDRIAIEAVANNGDGQALLDQLKELGLTEGVAYKRIIFGYLPVDKIGELKNVSLLSFARPYYEPLLRRREMLH